MYRRSNRQRVALAALIAASATVVTFDFRQNNGGPLRRIQDGAISVVAPVQEGISKVLSPFGDLVDSVKELSRLRRENADLRSRLERLEGVQREFPEVARENKRLLDLVHETDWKAGRRVGARVISGAPSNHEWSDMLDKGQAEGISVGMTVVSAEGLVGRVVLTSDNYAKVLLAIDPQHSVGARLTTSGETGVVTGRSERDLMFEFIDQDVKVDEGETVVTSGYDRGLYPAGIPIGRVTRVAVARDGLSKTAYVRPFVDFTSLDLVLVLLESGKVRGTP
ncbi:MAG: rod shape-determining protein MreC [Actinomycetota bacterium]